jgi:fructose-1-phosphate kinase PfkB-like protein
MILTVTITPCIDRSIFVDKLTIGKIIRVNSSKEIIGGKGVNASRLINNLGKKTLALVAVGGLYGKKVCKLIKEQDGFSFEPIWISGETKIINTVLDKSNNVQTAYIEPTPILTDVDKNKIFKTYLKHLPKAKIVVLSGSVAEGKHSNIFQEMIVFARKRNIRAILDSRGSALTLGIKAKPFMVKPNVEEAGNILGKEINKTSDYWKCIDYCISLGI